MTACWLVGVGGAIVGGALVGGVGGAIVGGALVGGVGGAIVAGAVVVVVTGATWHCPGSVTVCGGLISLSIPGTNEWMVRVALVAVPGTVCISVPLAFGARVKLSGAIVPGVALTTVTVSVAGKLTFVTVHVTTSFPVARSHAPTPLSANLPPVTGVSAPADPTASPRPPAARAMPASSTTLLVILISSSFVASQLATLTKPSIRKPPLFSVKIESRYDAIDQLFSSRKLLAVVSVTSSARCPSCARRRRRRFQTEGVKWWSANRVAANWC